MKGSAPHVFVSYRRDDADGYAGRLGDALADRFGADHVFLDVVSIAPGGDFVDAIRAAIAACDVFVPVIGPRWSQAADDRGRPRIDDPDDVVRLEIEAALEQDVQVIPVLVGDASMPLPDELPPTLRGLARRNAVAISSARWAFDISRLIASLEGEAQDDGQAWIPPRELRYAPRDDASIAFEVMGRGPTDLVYLPSWASNIEWNHRYAPYHHWLEELAQVCRLIVVDRRGLGCSDGISESLDEHVDDLLAVLDATGSHRVTLLGVQETTLIALLAAATHPKRITKLILFDACASYAPTEDGATTWGEDDWEAVRRTERAWGSASYALSWAQSHTPSLLDDDRALEWLTTMFRLTCGPEGRHAETRLFMDADVRHVLVSVIAPTLVLRRSGDAVFTEAECRYVVERLSNASFEELPGDDAMPWAGDTRPVTEAIARFVSASGSAASVPR